MRSVDVRSVKGIIFDLDGTLYRMRWFMRPLLFAKLFPRSARLPRFLAVRERFAGIDHGSRDALLGAVAAGLAAREGISADAAGRWIHDRFYPAFVAVMPPQRSGRPGLAETLRLLKARGLRLAVLSDYDAVAQRLGKLRISTDNFDILTSCEAAGALKPSARPFTEIAAAWELPCESILVVGDRDDTDGEAARRAGMRFLAVGDAKRRRGAPGFRSWRETKDILRTIAES